MSKTDSFLGNKKLSSNQNVWGDHATMQQETFQQTIAGLLRQQRAGATTSA